MPNFENKLTQLDLAATRFARRTTPLPHSMATCRGSGMGATILRRAAIGNLPSESLRAKILHCPAYCAAGLLMLAAAAKWRLHQESGVLEGGLFGDLSRAHWGDIALVKSRWAVQLLIGGEWLLGLWLLIGAHRRQAAYVAAALFLGFAGVSLVRLGKGESSCGCFGSFSVSPAVMLFIDLSLAIGLLVTAGRIGRRPASATLRGSLCGAIGVVVIFLALRNASANQHIARPGFELIPAEISLGEVPRRSRREAQFQLINHSAREITIDRVETSCGCLIIETPVRIPVAGKARVKALVDLSREPTFTGRLRLQARGFDAEGKQAFLLHVGCLVR